MAKHIGIVAVSPEGSALCYREIFRVATRLVGDQGHPTVTLNNEPFERYIDAVVKDDWHGVGALLRKSAGVLAQAGADFCIIPDNLMQHAVHLAEVGSPIPWLTMTDLVADAVQGDRRKSVGLIGTRMVMLGSTYQSHLGLRGVQVLVPPDDEASAIDAIIFRELVYGVVNPQSQSRTLEIISRLADRGCEGVILGCTEAPLLVTAANSPLPVYDSVGLLAEGAVRRALGMPAREPRGGAGESPAGLKGGTGNAGKDSVGEPEGSAGRMSCRSGTLRLPRVAPRERISKTRRRSVP